MYFKPYYLGCLAHASYLIGGDHGAAAVIDPRRDVEEYLADAEAVGLTIRYVIETHLHADFVSGHVELARRTGAGIYIGALAAARFAHHPVREGDEIALGDVTLRFLETPGHTPEGITVLALLAGETMPRMMFTGDTLFIGDVGRPDLVGSKGLSAEEMAGRLYSSLADKILNLPDSTEIWPAHGAGSSCGRALSEERMATLGRQRAANPALRLVAAGDRSGFIRHATEGLPPAPVYFAHDARRNREPMPTIEEILAAARPLPPGEVEHLTESGVRVLDTRSIADFGEGHLPGAVHVPLDGKFAPWVGVVLGPDMTLLVAADPGREREAITRLARIGYDQCLGWLDGGLAAWREAGGEIERTPQCTAAALRRMLADTPSLCLLDVRGGDEWEAGHVPGSIHIPLPELDRRRNELPGGPVAILCGSGYRSSIACSLLQRAGRTDVTNVSGGWEAWQSLDEGR